MKVRTRAASTKTAERCDVTDDTSSFLEVSAALKRGLEAIGAHVEVIGSDARQLKQGLGLTKNPKHRKHRILHAEE